MNYENLSREELIAELEDRDFIISEIRGVITPSFWGFTMRKACWSAVCLLAESAPRTVTREALLLATSSDSANLPIPKTIDVHICNARKALEPLGLAINTHWASGYSMSRADAEKWQRWMKQSLAGFPPCPDFPLRKSPSETFTTVGEAATRVLKRVAHD